MKSFKKFLLEEKFDGFSDIDIENYLKKENIVDLNKNATKLEELSQNDWVLLFHATDKEYADNIFKTGFGKGKKNWEISKPEYTYLGERDGLNAYLEPHSNPVILFVKVRVKNILPDNEDDWKTYVKNNTNKKILQNFDINKTKPSASDTLRLMNQVKAENKNVIPLGIFDYDKNKFYLKGE